MLHAHRHSPVRQGSPGARACGGGPQAASPISSSSCSLPDTCRYSDMGAVPASAAARAIEIASSPSASATRIAACTIAARVRVGSGPLRRVRSRIPQAAATASGTTGWDSGTCPIASPPLGLDIARRYCV